MNGLIQRIADALGEKDAEIAELKEEISEQLIDMTKLVSEYRQEIAELTKVIELMGGFIKNAFNFTPPPIEYFTQRAKEIIRKEKADEKTG